MLPTAAASSSSSGPGSSSPQQLAAAIRSKDLPDGMLNFPGMELEVLELWNQVKAFETSLKRSEGRKPYTFYDGPPFATGLPHYGHLLAGTIKDIVCRYAHQTGHYVERRFGWDCHGLPIEFEIEKELGIKSSHDVKKMGIDKYNAACRGIVMRYSSEWEKIVARCGRWIDFKNDYKTMDIKFMESVWWVFKSLWNKRAPDGSRLVYRGFKVMPYSTACTTPLSNFECNMNYKEVSDPSVVITFPLEEDPETHLVAWTTTPWTLPSNLALCVNPELDYLIVLDHKTKKKHIFAECRLEELYKKPASTEKGEKGEGKEQRAESQPNEQFTLISKVKGSTLIGKRYVPLFPYFYEKMKTTAFRVLGDAYVTKDTGTGIVHSAPGFGEDDFRICLREGVVTKGNIVCPVDENGMFTPDVSDWAGRYIKDCDNEICAKIKSMGRLITKGSIIHNYPFCWRSETPLIYKAVDAWFVSVESFRDKLLAANGKTNWVPDFVKSKRFSNWISEANDWNVSRNRYWGTPLPIWHSEDWEEIEVVGSVAELEKLSGVQGITDIHREFVDVITIPSSRPGRPPLKRVSQVFDCWFESGSMPYGQCHYPFENKEEFEKRFPADFIAEGLDQTRGWFYTLLVLATALFDQPPYLNLIVNGLVLAEDGKKMSKRLKNYPEVSLILEKYGADALRLYLINSPVVRAEPLRFREAGVKDIIKDVFLPFFNVLKFFSSNAVRYVELGHCAGPHTLSLTVQSTNDMDRWILAATQTLIQYVRREMEGYRLYTVVPGILQFVDTLTNWYVRMNRRRLKGQSGDNVQDWCFSLSTLLQVLFSAVRILAPLTPFTAENMFQRLKPLLPAEFQEDSIHYLMIPDVDKTKFDDRLELSMNRMIKIIDLVRVLRDRIGIPMKMPVSQIVVVHPDPAYLASLQAMKDYVETEANAFELILATKEADFVDVKLDVNFPVLGKRLKKECPVIRQALQKMSPEEVHQVIQKNFNVTVCGQALTSEDIRLLRTPRAGLDHLESNSDNDVVVFVDKRKDENLLHVWRAREFVNRVQSLRKSAGLVIADVVDVYYDTPSDVLKTSLTVCAAQVSATVKGLWTTADKKPSDGVVVATLRDDIDEAPIAITFTKPSKP